MLEHVALRSLRRIYASEGQIAAAILALGASLGFDNNMQRMAASAGLIKSLMESAVAVREDEATIAVVDTAIGLPVDSMNRLSTRIPLMYAGLATAQQKSGGDTSYEPYAMTFISLVSAFVEAGIDPSSHFAADHYSKLFEPMVENGHLASFAHVIMAPLNPQASGTWVQAHRNEFEAFLVWRDRR